MATTAVVTLTVDESGAIAGLNRFKQEWEQNVKDFKTTSGTAAQALDRLGEAGTEAGNSMSKGFHLAQGHVMTQLDTVRLLRDDLGVRVPRAMEKLIASTEAFQVVASAAFGVFAFVGVVELLDTIGQKIASWSHDLMGDSKAVQELHKALVAANDARLVNPTNSNAAVANAAALKEEIRLLEAKEEMNKVERIPDWVLGNALIDPKNQTADQKNALGFMTERDYARLEQAKKELGDLDENNGKREQALNAENLRSKRESTTIALDGYRRIEQARKNAHAEVFDKVHGTNNVTVSLDAKQGAEEDKNIDAKAAEEYKKLSIGYSIEVRDAWQASAVSRLRGEQRSYAEMYNAVHNYEEKARREGRMDSPQGQAQIFGVEQAMWIKYQNEKQQRTQQFVNQTTQMQEQARVFETDGTKRLLAEETVSLDKLTQERIESGRQAAEFDQIYADRRVAIEADTNAKIAKSVEDYSDREKRMREQLTASSTHGFTQIAAERRRSEAAALEEYKKLTDGMKSTDQGYLDATATYRRELADIATASDNKSLDLHRRNADSLTSIDDETRDLRTGAFKEGLLGMFVEEQVQTQKISTEYEKRQRKLKESFDQGLVDAREFAQQQQAIEQLHDAQMEEQQRNLRDKLASAIEGGFKDPMSALKDAMKHRMAEILADWVLQLEVFKRFFGNSVAGGGAGAATGPGGILGVLMGQHGAAAQAGSNSPGGWSEHLGMPGPGGIPGAMSFLSGGGSPAAVAANARGGFGNLGSLGGTSSLATPNAGVSPIPLSTLDGIGGISGMSGTGGGGSGLGSLAGLGGWGGDGSGTMSESAGLPAPSGGNVPFGSTLPGGSSSGSGGTTAATTASEAGQLAGAGAAAYAGGKSIYDAFYNEDPLGGMLGGAAAGAAIGSIAGPMGTLIGGAIGAGVGLASGIAGKISGEGGKLAARDYYRNTLFPDMERQERSYMYGSGDWQTALGQVNSTAAQGYRTMRFKWGTDAADWVRNSYLNKETAKVVADITRAARGGREFIAPSAVEFHEGGRITGFGDWSTSRNEGMIHAMLDETVMNRAATTTHGPMLGAMNSGATPAEIAGMYLRASTPTASAPGATGGDTHHWHVSAIDAHSFDDFLRRGGMNSIARAANRRNGLYTGDGV